MSTAVQQKLKQFYNLLVKEDIMKFPSLDQTVYWESVLNDWIENEDMPLFVRKPASIRGSTVTHLSKRKIIVTDNTPAHWIYKKIVLDKERPSLKFVEECINKSNFPYAIMMKKSEKNYLVKSQIATKDFRLGSQNWKIAHIERIALPRAKNISIIDFKEHHRKFLSLKNMYIIKKEFSGLAEVEMFNHIILQNVSGI